MAEIIGKIDPEVLRARQWQSTLDKPGMVQQVRRYVKEKRNEIVAEQGRKQHFDILRKHKEIVDKRETKRVMSGKFNSVRVSERIKRGE